MLHPIELHDPLHALAYEEPIVAENFRNEIDMALDHLVPKVELACHAKNHAWR